MNNGYIEVSVKDRANEFIEKFNIDKLDFLKNNNDYEKLDDGLKKKIYEKVYYIQKKNKTEGFEVKKKSRARIATPQNSQLKQKSSKINFLYIPIVAFLLVFLMGESRLFYLSYGFSSFNSYILPVVVECSILLLSLHKDFKSKILMVLLILFNVVSFSFFTIDQHDKKVVKIKSSEVRRNTLLSEKSRLLSEYGLVKESISSLREKYEAAFKSKYITRANGTYLPQIKSQEGRFKEISNALSEANKKIEQTKVAGSENILLIGCISLVFLKVVFQFILIIFLKMIRSKEGT